MCGEELSVPVTLRHMEMGSGCHSWKHISTAVVEGEKAKFSWVTEAKQFLVPHALRLGLDSVPLQDTVKSEKLEFHFI